MVVPSIADRCLLDCTTESPRRRPPSQPPGSGAEGEGNRYYLYWVCRCGSTRACEHALIEWQSEVLDEKQGVAGRRVFRDVRERFVRAGYSGDWQGTLKPGTLQLRAI